MINNPQKIDAIDNVSFTNRRIDRDYHLDWLRALIVFLLIPYHTAIMFEAGNPLGWINNSSSSLIATSFVQILDQFQMPLIFTIAGIAAWFSLARRTGKQYFFERLGRLFVPLIFGILIVNVPIYYISLLYHHIGGSYNNSYLIWYKAYIKTMLFPWQKNWTPETMWFIWYLLIYSIALLPLFLFWRRKINADVYIKIGKYFEKRGIFLFLLFLAFFPVVVQVYSLPNFYSVFRISYFIFFYIYGFFLYSSKQIQQSIEKSGFIILAIGVISIILVMLLIIPSTTSAPLAVYWHFFGNGSGIGGEILYLMLRGVSCWFTIVGLIFVARKFANFSNKFLRYANEAVLPFYLMHATFIRGGPHC